MCQPLVCNRCSVSSCDAILTVWCIHVCLHWVYCGILRSLAESSELLAEQAPKPYASKAPLGTLRQT